MTQFSPIRPYLLRIPLTPNSANRCNIVFRGTFQIEVMPSDLSICLYLYLFISVCTYQFVSVHMCICAHCISSCVCVCIWSACYDVIIFVQFVWGYGCLFSFECHCHPSWWWVSPSITYYWMPFLICISSHRPLPTSTILFWAYSLLTSDDLLISWFFCFPVEHAGCISSLLTMTSDWP